jgi:hypothetical protein
MKEVSLESVRGTDEWYEGMAYAMRPRKKKKKPESDLHKWLRFFCWLFTGLAFCGGVLAAYIGMILLVGTP